VPKRLSAKQGFTAWALVVFAFLYLPIMVMAIFAFNKPSATSVAAFHGANICNIPPTQIGNITVWNGFTSCWFSAGLHDPTYIPAIVTSLQIAAVAAVISTLLGLCAALALARMRPRFRAPFDALVYLTLVVPEIVIAIVLRRSRVRATPSQEPVPGLDIAAGPADLDLSGPGRWCRTPRVPSGWPRPRRR
jgi:ABC-type spermidine/putrescine transport system permease subunit II